MTDRKESDVYEMLLAVVRSLVDRPEDIHIEPVRHEDSITFRVQAHPADMGRLIGTNGRTAHALRILAAANAARLERGLAIDFIQAPPRDPSSGAA